MGYTIIIFLILVILFSHFKSPKIIEVLKEPEEIEVAEIDSAEDDTLTDRQLSVLRLHSGLEPGYGIVPSEISDNLKIHIEEARYVHESYRRTQSKGN